MGSDAFVFFADVLGFVEVFFGVVLGFAAALLFVAVVVVVLLAIIQTLHSKVDKPETG